ncbi:toprim domain-containing protein [Aureimonas sp. SA4125]|uniref:toprim domain-containing protein n=1 Tax=Aureimonas sp. SA4125 TaxID=2826993 RepID=UPI001CC5BB8E|nr:toprim domain-containing protein [Aureimonas sp. SA4125]
MSEFPPRARTLPTDANTQGEAFAFRLRAIAEAADCDWLRLKPSAEDWNEVLRTRVMEKRRTRRKGNPTAAWPPSASRVTLRPALPALDPAGRNGGRTGGVRKG